MRSKYDLIPESALRKLYLDQGLSLRSVALKYQCDAGVIRRALNKYDIPVRQPTAKQIFSERELARLYRVENHSTYTLAERYNCDPKTIYRHLKLNGITPRRKRKISLTKDMLERLYIQESRSLAYIATLYEYSPSGILKKLQEFRIPRRTTSEANTKHPKYDFNKDQKEKAYLIGFRLGDLGIRKIRNFVYVSSSTTKSEQVELIRGLFSPYGPVWVSKPGKTGAVNVSASLNQSFSFLLPKHATIPKWVCASRACFFSFLAGYTDAEGNLQIANGTARFRLRSYDVGILQDLREGLARFGIPSTFGLERAAGVWYGKRQNKDCWRLAVADTRNLRKLLNVLLPYLRHGKRREDAQAAMDNVVFRTR